MNLQNGLTPTKTPTRTPTRTPRPTRTPTRTPRPSRTPTQTATPIVDDGTPRPTPTSTPRSTKTPTPTKTNTKTPTPTKTRTPTPTPTKRPTSSSVPNITPTPTPTKITNNHGQIKCPTTSFCVTVSGASYPYSSLLHLSDGKTYVQYPLSGGAVWLRQPNDVQEYNFEGQPNDWPLTLKRDLTGGYFWSFGADNLFVSYTTVYTNNPFCPPDSPTKWYSPISALSSAVFIVRQGSCVSVTPTPSQTKIIAATPTPTLWYPSLEPQKLNCNVRAISAKNAWPYWDGLGINQLSATTLFYAVTAQPNFGNWAFLDGETGTYQPVFYSSPVSGVDVWIWASTQRTANPLDSGAGWEFKWRLGYTEKRNGVITSASWIPLYQTYKKEAITCPFLPWSDTFLNNFMSYTPIVSAWIASLGPVGVDTPLPTPTPTNPVPTQTLLPDTISNPFVVPSSSTGFRLFDYSTFDTEAQATLQGRRLRDVIKYAATVWEKYIQISSNIYPQLRTAFNAPNWNGLQMVQCSIVNSPNEDFLAACSPSTSVSLGGIKSIPKGFSLMVNQAKMMLLPDEKSWARVFIHELGHALGIGSSGWYSSATLDSPNSAHSYTLNGLTFTNTMSAYNKIVKSSFTRTPIDYNGSHWRAYSTGSVIFFYPNTYPELDYEIMCPVYDKSMRITQLSIQNLVDLGYQEVNPGNSEGLPVVVDFGSRINTTDVTKLNTSNQFKCCHQLKNKLFGAPPDVVGTISETDKGEFIFISSQT